MEISEQNNKNTKMLWLLSTASFLVLFQIYLIAPLISSLGKDLNASPSLIGLAVPAYTIPYGISTLFYGPLSDRLGRRAVLLTLLGLMGVLTLLMGFSRSTEMFLILRVLSGIITGGIVPIAISLIGDKYPFELRGKPIGMLYACMAGGMALGSTAGAYLNPIIGWRNEFIITGILCLLIFGIAMVFSNVFKSQLSAISIPVKEIITSSFKLLRYGQGKKLYPYIFLNGVFHSGIFSWLGYYFVNRYGLNDQQIGLALLGYGIPGMFLGVSIGKAADRSGRKNLTSIGLAAGAVSVMVMSFKVPLWIAAVAVTTLSLGYDMTQPLFAGMVTGISPDSNRGQAVSLAACLLFLGYGVGSLCFQQMLYFGLDFALWIFISLELILLFFAKALFAKSSSNENMQSKTS